MSRPSARPAFRFVAFFAALAVISGPVSAAPAGITSEAGTDARQTAPIVEVGLLAQLETGVTDRFVVEFAPQADLAPAPDIAGFGARGTFVVNALTATADAAQADAIALVAGTPGARAESYWLRNTLIVSGSASLAEQLAALPGVATVRAERVFPLVKPVEMDVTVVIEAAEPEWGVAKIGADAVWNQGILGSGIVVANIDTGVDYEHPALVEQYRGNLGDGSFDHNYSWWDPTGICGDIPCDNAQHGTHTMGTMVGGDGPGPFTPDVGVAPGARWIAAKGCEDFGCTEGSLLSSGQFMLAPTDLAGDNPDPARRPDIVNNSWGGGPGDPFYAEVVEAWRAAGIVPVFSSGNAGPGCGSGGAPGDMDGAFSAGATDINDVIADFSGRGPSPAGKINPNVSAPGVDVVSTIPGGGYASFSGTSMAAPHAAGTLALIMSAEPGLIGQVEGSTAAVRDTAVDIIDEQCGGAEDGDPNNVYGDGRIDALAAVALVATGGTLAGTITDATTGDPIGGAQVSAANGARTFTATTAEDGTYDLFLAAGTYAVTASAFGYEQALAESVEIVTDQTTTQDFGLTPLPRFDVTGVVTAASDGEPIAGARVVAIGTPVPPAVTDADGFYTLTLPQGSYTLRASAGGCTELGFADIVLDSDITQDFEIARKLDDFGHGCAPIAFDWVDATTQTALFGDEFAGRLRLPFDFSFYGETYSQVFISDNGYLNFLGPDQFNGFPIEIPSESPPNAAIYALWQEMSVGESAAIEYDTVGDAPNRAFVLEYSEVSGHTFEIKLWENGDIDLLYADAGDGANAGIGIENAAGDDALQFSYLTDLLTPNDAYRYSVVPTGLVTGTVTDANDGLPVEGATVEAVGAGRSTTTAEDGTYQLRLLPGDYTIRISADGYTTFEQEISLAVDEVLVVDATLAAPIGSVEPTEINASVELGSSTDSIVTISNSGSGPLDWEVRERPTGQTPPDLPAIAGSPTREPAWARPSVPAGLPQARTTAIPPELLNEIIDDPAGDAVGSIDVDAVRAGADAAEITMQIDLTADTPINEAVGFVFLDTDQDPTTGLPADAFSGLPTQDVGLEYFVDLFLIHEPEPIVLIVDALTFEIVASTPARLEGQSIGFDVPLAAIGGDDGFVNTAMVLGDFFQPTDWAPDEGHGTIEPFTDAPWVSESPESGSVPAGESTEITVTLGGPDVAAGTYTGLLVFITNDPKNGPFVVDLTLTVTLPDSFGSVSGTVTDAHSGEPLPASISIAAEVDGQPYPVETTAGPDGTYRVFGPEGTWPATFSLDGYVPQTLDVTIVRGIDTPGVDVALHREQPHAVLEGGPLEFVLPPDATADETLVLSNPEGHSELTFEVGEVSLDAGPGLAPETAGRPLPAGADPNSVTTRGLGLDDAVPDTRSITVVGDVLASWPTGLDLAWGVGFTGNVWLSDVLEAGDACGISDACTNHEFDTAGTPTGAVIEAPWVDAFHADMAYDPGRNWLWQVHVGGENGIYGLDVTDGSVEEVLTGSPWSDASQRGVAYDPGSDTFYIGGWNEGVIYHVAGPSWPTPGETLASCAPADPAISGLAWNPAFSLLWVATNSDSDTIYLVDPVTCETLQALAHPEPGFSGAGIEIDAAGNLWTVSQASSSAFLIESGLPNFSDAPWLSVTPETGSVPIDGSVDLTVSVNTTGLAPGAYRAQVVILTNDPDNSSLVVPVLLVVPEYQLGVNAGGPAYTAVDGTAYATDRAYRAGSYGYVGAGAVKSTRAAIAGTDDDRLYQRMRQNMIAYRFDVPVEGIYRVDLAFAEIVARRAGARVFSVIIEGQAVVSNLDVYAEVGANTALGRSLDVLVTDGTLDVEFFTHRGDRAFVSALLVTHRPDMAAE